MACFPCPLCKRHIATLPCAYCGLISLDESHLFDPYPAGAASSPLHRGFDEWKRRSGLT